MLAPPPPPQPPPLLLFSYVCAALCTTFCTALCAAFFLGDTGCRLLMPENSGGVGGFVGVLVDCYPVSMRFLSTSHLRVTASCFSLTTCCACLYASTTRSENWRRYILFIFELPTSTILPFCSDIFRRLAAVAIGIRVKGLVSAWFRWSDSPDKRSIIPTLSFSYV